MKNKLVQQLSTSVSITPQLQQILKLLQLNNLDLVDEIIRELSENPLVEFEEKTEYLPVEELEKNLQIEKEYARFKRENFESLESIENFSQTKSLQEYLFEQISELNVSEQFKEVLRVATYYLNRNGFREISDTELASICNLPVETVKEALEYFKSFDPVGVGARDAIESLCWQLSAMGLNSDSIPVRILTEFKELLVRGRFDLISKKLGVEEEKVFEAIKIIRNLNPKPGLQFDNEFVLHVQPDLRVEIVGDSLRVELVKTKLPKIKFKKEYVDNCNDKELARIFREKIRLAQNLTKACKQRESSLLRIAQTICEEQRQFLISKGAESLKPLTLKDIATKLNLHESTVSRATNNKFIETPFGIFELKRFFVNRINEENSASSDKVKTLILEIVNTEDKENPYNDAEIANILNQKFKINIARRTVAKYRENLKIPSAVHRRQLAERRFSL